MTAEDTPSEQRRDIANTLVRAGISLVPGGGAINELLSLVILPSLADRQQRWLEAIDFELSRLREKVGALSFDDLRERPGFTSSFIQASRVAATTHQQEKLEALKNAVINAVLSPDMDDETQAVFIALIDDYTPWHIRLLDFFVDPVACATRRGAETAFDGIMAGGLSTVLERVFPELKGHREFYDRIAGNLERDQLVGASGLHVTMSGQGLRQGRATDFGRSFLRFISEPEA